LVWFIWRHITIQQKKPQGDSMNRKEAIMILLPLSLICADCIVTGGVGGEDKIEYERIAYGDSTVLER
jgi:hypothetical protein